MNHLVTSNDLICTTWIAEKTGKQHRHILRDIEGRFKGKLGDDIDSYKSIYINLQNKEQPCYRLPLWAAATVIACYDIKAASEISKIAAESLDIIKALESFEVPDDLPDMYVYAIREAETGNVKIGISKDPAERLKQLQTGNSSELVLVASMPAVNRYKDESSAHKKLSNINIRGEWFECGAENKLPFDGANNDD